MLHLPLLTLLGPTATGKTRLAALLANALDGEIISADSRQVFRRMDIGTGKDIADYTVDGNPIPYHLVDIAEPGTEFSVYDFNEHFSKIYSDIVSRGKLPLMCGGTGLYLESVIKGYNLLKVPFDAQLHSQLSKLDMEELAGILGSYKTLHNTTDNETRDRLQRAVEIEIYKSKNLTLPGTGSFEHSPVFGLRCNRELNRQRISGRLRLRLENGMIEEVKKLIAEGVSTAQLKKYGLEYKFITMYLMAELSYQQMTVLLETAIHQFAKRQMTWFRRMERSGVRIHWLEGEAGNEANLHTVLRILDEEYT